ncbi:MAG: carboxymuconolactone decarboxylase family protein [Candidatus Thiodiazotropha sp. (ex Dulcina madagascariensis)]|nr:carboxymuconolactone decarboxylase family protein [Candidatus Thiodiazotropha sp. (ex Epidulcina cf. delphinae)]MCU7927021.1 carboxymuconolactone decarboxylase family protein [Candidatus Thiodiazotropha sp. (ex Dulcina madagascariensis)]MCU7933661.1 carboxymuconolactone decarboxylase family protein [Candidatus Thiodiazotropha sp. (ex Dulcina madagascariensis)]
MSEVDLKIREMIALGVAYSLNCHKCLEVHKQAAKAAGLSPDEMNQAISIAESVVDGARNLTKDVAFKLFGKEVEDVRCCPVGSECCP